MHSQRERVIDINMEELRKENKNSTGLVLDGVGIITSSLGIKLGKEVNSRLIASLQAVVKEVQQSSVLRSRIGK